MHTYRSDEINILKSTTRKKRKKQTQVFSCFEINYQKKNTYTSTHKKKKIVNLLSIFCSSIQIKRSERNMPNSVRMPSLFFRIRFCFLFVARVE
jgi:hypothetical protein